LTALPASLYSHRDPQFKDGKLKILAILMLLVLELAVCGCGTTSPSTEQNTTTSGSWEVQLTGGHGPASQLNFVTAFTLTDSGPLDITGFGFFNAGTCFTNGTDASTESGTATLSAASTSQVTGTLTFTVTSATTGSVLSLTNGQLTGTTNGTVGVTGTLSNGVVTGDWALQNPGDATCNGGGTFLMCQGTSTCTVTVP
jgi:hypothetical protein